MAARTSLNPTTQSVGFTAKLVTVQSVSADGKTAVCVDRLNTQTLVSMLVQRSKAPLPAAGETWLLTQDLGMWAFAAFVASSPLQFGLAGSSDVAVQPTAPSAPATGDLWMNTAAGNQFSEWTGMAWSPLQFGTSALADGSVTAAKIAPGTITSAQIAPDAGIAAAQVAFTASDIGGVRIFRNTEEPADPQPGDMWLNPNAGNQLSEWTGSEWDPVLLGALAIQPSSLTTDQLSGEAGITAGQVAFTYRDLGGMAATISVSEPETPAVGDLWYDATDDYTLKQWNGSEWVKYQFGTNAIAAGSITAELIAAETITTAQLAAGLVVAGIINGTTVNAATFTGSVFEGPDFLINEDGYFFYNGTPAAGNLILSLTSPVGGQFLDNFGNMVVAGGFVTYNEYTLGSYIAVQYYAGGISILGASGYAGPYSAAGAGFSFTSAGLGNIAFTGGTFTWESDEDSNTYQVGCMTVSPATTVNVTSTSPVAIFTINVAIGTYRIHVKIIGEGQQAGGSPVIGYGGGTATISNGGGDGFWKNPSGGYANGFIYNGASNIGGIDTGSFTMTNGGLFTYEADLLITFSVAGTFEIRGQEGTSGDSWAVSTNSFLDLRPV